MPSIDDLLQNPFSKKIYLVEIQPSFRATAFSKVGDATYSYKVLMLPEHDKHNAICLEFTPSNSPSHIRIDLTNVQDYDVQEGDVLEYEVFWEKEDARIGVNLYCSDGSQYYASGAIDQNNFSAAYYSDISSKCYAKWYKRYIPFARSWVGKTIVRYEISAYGGSGIGGRGYIKNLKITNGGKTKLIIWNGEEVFTWSVIYHVNVSSYNIYGVHFIENEITCIEGNGTIFTQKNSKEEVETNAGSWYFDRFSRILYVRNTATNQITNNDTIIAYFFVYLTNFLNEKDSIIYNQHIYRPLLLADSIPDLTYEIKNLFEGNIVPAVGSLSIIPDEAIKFGSTIWNLTNHKLQVKLGGEEFQYSDFANVFLGKIQDIELIPGERMNFQLQDIRTSMVRDLPINKYWKSNYPNLESGAEGLPVPILYGEKKNIKPVCIDTTNHRYKISDHALYSIDKIYKDGEQLTSGYTLYPDQGEFTLSFDPAQAIITCDAKGKKDGSGTLITNASDIILDIFKTYLGFTEDDLDLASFSESKNLRTYEMSLYLSEPISAFEVIRTIEQSVIGYTMINADGKIGFYVYKAEIPHDALQLYDVDFFDFQIFTDANSIYKEVNVHYNQDPITKDYEKVSKENTISKYKYKIEKSLNIYTYIKNQTEAQNLCDAIANLFQEPQRYLKFKTWSKIFRKFPSEKIIITYKKAPAKSGHLEAEVYRILKKTLFLKEGTAAIEAISDLQSLGEILCYLCYSCQSCFTAQQSCQICNTCQNCYTNQCGACVACQICNTCQNCNTDQSGGCQTCQVCNTCQICNSCQACVSCDSCYTCQSCVSSQCANCYTCQACNVCQLGF